MLGRRPDGYHDLQSLVAFADVGDTLRLSPGDGLTLAVHGPSAAQAGPDADNLVLKAASALASSIVGVRLGAFELEKVLPVAAGLGGGSADAAAALRLLARANELRLDDVRLYEAACATGADVPVCLDPRARVMRGIGEILSAPLALPPLPAVLVNSGVAVATKDVFARWNPSPSPAPLFDWSAVGAIANRDQILRLLRLPGQRPGRAGDRRGAGHRRNAHRVARALGLPPGAHVGFGRNLLCVVLDRRRRDSRGADFERPASAMVGARRRARRRRHGAVMADSTEPLGQYAQVWKRKPVLRLIYDDFYDRLVAQCRPGLTIEIGGGIGNLKQRLGDVVATDIQFAPWLDCVADAQRLPFAASCAANIVMVDVLHHVEFPVAFFREVERVLRPGGRVLMVEPAITWGSTLFYRFLHQEPVRTSADILVDGRPSAGRDPYDSNQAIPTLLATRDRERFHRLFPGLRIARVDWFSFAAYPLSGGFQRWSLLGAGMARRLLQIERAVEPVLGRHAAFRMMMVVEKTAGAA